MCILCYVSSMALKVDDVLQELAKLADATRLKVTDFDAWKASAISGVAVAIGVATMGPAGAALGRYAVLIIIRHISITINLVKRMQD